MCSWFMGFSLSKAICTFSGLHQAIGVFSQVQSFADSKLENFQRGILCNNTSNVAPFDQRYLVVTDNLWVKRVDPVPS